MIDLPIGVNVAILVVASGFVWAAGTRLAGHADDIAARTGLSQGFVGMLVLGIATSLPEIATTVTGAAIDNARLVVGNLFGGVAMQIAILAVVDLLVVRGALTYFAPRPVLLLQGAMLLLLLALALAGSLAGEPLAFFGVGLTSVLLLAGYGLTLWLSSRPEFLPRWKPLDTEGGDTGDDEGSGNDEPSDRSDRRLYTMAAMAALVILAGGWALAQAGDALAEQTGLGASFVGVTLIATSTSLPELSTSLEAARRGRHEMAVSGILGTNCLEVGLFFLADVVYRKGPILATADRSGQFAAALGMIVTAVLLIGLLERRNRTVGRMGVDSLLVLVMYLSGLAVLYHLR